MLAKVPASSMSWGRHFVQVTGRVKLRLHMGAMAERDVASATQRMRGLPSHAMLSSSRHCSTLRGTHNRGAKGDESVRSEHRTEHGFSGYEEGDGRAAAARRTAAASSGFKSSFLHSGGGPDPSAGASSSRSRSDKQDDCYDGGSGRWETEEEYRRQTSRAWEEDDAKHADTNATRAATPQDRRRISQKWENAFFGRVHYEKGMHERFKAARDAEDADSSDGALDGSQPQPNRILFPHWPEDEEAPIRELRKLPPGMVKRYIVNRLSMGERRLRFAADYGSLLMMQHMNLGEMMVNEAEQLLHEFNWMNDDVAAKIARVREEARRIKYDLDLN